MNTTSTSMLRVATETLIKLANICKAYEFVEAYIKTGQHQRLLFVRGMKNNPAPAYDFILPELTDELIDEITKSASDKKVAEWARDADMSVLYNVPYRLFSQDVHSAPASLERYLGTNEEGELTDVNWGPDVTKEIHAELIEAARLIILGLWTVDPVFSLGITDKLAEFTNELRALDADH